MSPTFDFDDSFETLTGYRPFPWQRRLFEKHFACGTLPPAVDIPTGLGKTAVMAVWLLARAMCAGLPRRLVYVVDRRTVVDQATEFAEHLRDRLEKDEGLKPVRQGLCLGGRRLPISTLRGRHADNREWMADPAGLAIIVGTVDMVGSRLLFEGYGLSRRMRPYVAGLLGCDTLVMLDEAHLARPFERLLRTIEEGQRPSSTNGEEASAGVFAGPAAGNRFPPTFCVLPLSATLGLDSERQPFSLDREDEANETVRTRLQARKRLRVQDLPSAAKLEQALADEAWALMQAGSAAAETPPAVAIYCHRREHAEKVAGSLRKRAGREEPRPRVILLVGSRRVREREEADTELREHGLIGDGAVRRSAPVFFVATAAGEVGVDLDADHMVCDLVAWERMVQRLGRVNRRGTGSANVLAIDLGRPDVKKAGEEAVARHEAVCRLLDALPHDEAGGRRAGPGVLADLGADPAQRARIAAATTLMPLYPALTRPLVDAWSMTSLEEHAGRPEVGPWLRGWVDDEPQTAVVWRRYLPLRFTRHSDAQAQPELRTFFATAPPQTAELLETETTQVAAWLKKRADRRLKLLNEVLAPAPAPDDGANDGEETVATTGRLAPLTRDGPVAFLLDGANRPLETLSLAAISEYSPNALRARLAGKRLVLDARFGGIAEGLLTVDADGDGCAATVEDNWGRQHEDPEKRPWTLKVEVLSDDEHGRRMGDRAASEGAPSTADAWQDELHAPYGVSAEGEAESWLVVSRRRGTGESEDARAIARKAQRLDEHQRWAGQEAKRIADRLGLGPEDKAMLVAAARHHDDGKAAKRWQQAFNAPPDWREGGAYAKTTSSPNLRRLNGFRHELKSALDAEREGLEGIDRADPRFALALHLIAAHHGHARPAIRVRGYDEQPPSVAGANAHAIALRFARLQRHWGPWRLAWWEALLRAADQAASRRLEKDAEKGTGCRESICPWRPRGGPHRRHEGTGLMAEASVPVDLANPGQVFACLGFLEAADALLGEARGGFDWRDPADVRFRLAARSDNDPVVRVLRFLDEATVTSLAPATSPHSTDKWTIATAKDDSRVFPSRDSGPDVLPARLSDGTGKDIVIDHWGDQGPARRDRVKFWAGAGGYPGAGLARDALDLIRGRAADHADNPFALSAEQSSSFRFDWRRDYVPIDAGFSPNAHGNVVMRGYPVVELLAAIGLTHARPLRRERLEYRYGVAGLAGDALYDPIFLRAALGVEKAPFPGMPFRLFTMRLDWPGQEGQARCITDVVEETPNT